MRDKRETYHKLRGCFFRPNGPELSHAADAHMHRIQIRYKCQGVSLLMPLKKSNSSLPKAPGAAKRSDKKKQQ